MKTKIKKIIIGVAIFCSLLNYSVLAINTANADSKEDIEKYTAEINKNPNNAVAYIDRGNAKYYLGDNKGAILDYNKAVEINPLYANAYNNRGNAKGMLGDKSGAILDLEKAKDLALELEDMTTYEMAVKNINLISRVK